jgi:DNA-binding transcriptional LysR family regulator
MACVAQFARPVRKARLANGKCTLTVNSVPSFAACWLLPRLPAFYREHPGIQLEINVVGNPGQPIDIDRQPASGRVTRMASGCSRERRKYHRNGPGSGAEIRHDPNGNIGRD